MGDHVYKLDPGSRTFPLRVLSFFLLMLFPILAHAAPVPGLVKISSEGYAKGHGPEARAAAVVDAREQALRIWVESILGETAGDAYLAIIKSPDAYAQSSRLLNVEDDEVGTHVSVDVYVFEETLRADMAAVLMRTFPEPPRVALLIGEQVLPGEAQHFGPEGHVVSYLSAALRTVGFFVVDAAEVRSRYTERELLTYLRGGYQSVARFGRENNADVVISGTVGADLRVENPTGQTLRAHAAVTLDVVRSDAGQLYEAVATEAEVSCRVAVDGVRMAIEDATYKVRNAVLVGAALAAAGPSAGAPDFELRIESASGWQEIERVAQRLRQFDSVDKVEVLRSQSGAGIVHFEYGGKMAALVRHLRAPFSDGRILEPQRVGGGEMIFRFSDR